MEHHMYYRTKDVQGLDLYLFQSFIGAAVDLCSVSRMCKSYATYIWNLEFDEERYFVFRVDLVGIQSEENLDLAVRAWNGVARNYGWEVFEDYNPEVQIDLRTAKNVRPV